jgi:hypothetical protein
MGVFGYFSGPATKNVLPVAKSESDLKQSSPEPASSPPASTTVPSETEPEPSSGSTKPVSPEASDVPVVPQPEAESHTGKAPVAARRLSFRPFAATPKHKPILSEAQEHEKKASAANAFTKRWSKPLSSNSDKRAKESALIVRSLIVGPSSNDYASATITKAVAMPQLSKVKSQVRDLALNNIYYLRTTYF